MLSHGDDDQTFSTLLSAIENGFILGEQFSAVDVYISSQIGWGLMNKDLESNAIFDNYLKRCQDQPAFKRFMEKVKQMS